MSDVKELKEKLFIQRKNGLLRADDAEISAAHEYAKGYMKFLDTAKTEREAAAAAIALAEEKGFTAFDRSKKYKSGDKVYFNNRGKTVAFAVIGEETLENGVNITAAHIDSPRLDLKPNPLYEEIELALFKTHYYGGIRKYQWTAVPLALHGVFAKKDGSVINVNIGEDEGDPCFVVNDLLPHLAQDQMSKKMSEGIEGENLNILIGGAPVEAEDIKEKVKFSILKMLNARYGITENSFISAEIEVVPAQKAKNVGLDESFVGAYGHDDRVCAYTTLRGIIDIEAPKRTAVAILVDGDVDLDEYTLLGFSPNATFIA